MLTFGQPMSTGDALAKSAKILARQSWWHGYFYGLLTIAAPLVLSKFIQYELDLADLEAQVQQEKGHKHA